MKEYVATAALSVIFLRSLSDWQQRIRSFGFRGSLSSFQLITAEYPRGSSFVDIVSIRCHRPSYSSPYTHIDWKLLFVRDASDSLSFWNCEHKHTHQTFALLKHPLAFWIHFSLLHCLEIPSRSRHHELQQY